MCNMDSVHCTHIGIILKNNVPKLVPLMVKLCMLRCLVLKAKNQFQILPSLPSWPVVTAQKSEKGISETIVTPVVGVLSGQKYIHIKAEAENL